MKRIDFILVGILISCLCGTCFCCGVLYGSNKYIKYKIEYQTEIEYVPQIEYITEYKEVEVPKYINIEVVKYVEVEKNLRQFQSVEEMNDWFDNNDYIELIIPMDGTYIFSKQDDTNDCDDQAQRLKNRADKDGYDLDLQVVYNGKLGQTNVVDFKEPHMGCITIVGN